MESMGLTFADLDLRQSLKPVHTGCKELPSRNGGILHPIGTGVNDPRRCRAVDNLLEER